MEQLVFKGAKEKIEENLFLFVSGRGGVQIQAKVITVIYFSQSFMCVCVFTVTFVCCVLVFVILYI